MRPLLLLLVAAVARCHAAPAIDVLLPPGSTVVFGLRTANLLDLLARQDGAKDIRQQVSMLLAASPFSGFDPFHDIDEVVLATTGTGQNPPALIVITGRFDPAKLAQGAHPYHNIPLIQNAKSKQVMAVLDATTLLAGDPPLVKAAIDRAAANTSAGPLAARLQELRGRYDLWAFADHLDTAAVPAGSLPPAAEALRSLDRFWFGAAFTRNLEFSAELHLRSAQDASRIAAILREFESQAKAKIDAGSPAKFDLQAAGNSVTLAFSVPEEEWKKMLQQSQASAPPRPQSKPQPQLITTDSTGNTVTLTLPGRK